MNQVNNRDTMSETSVLSETKRRLLEKYLRGELAQHPQDLAITRRPTGVAAPLSLAQEQLWLRETAAPRAPSFYNECITIHFRGPLDAVLLERSLCEVIRRHEIWRTSYDSINGQLVQVVHPAPLTFQLAVVDLSGRPSAEREPEALRLATEDARRRFDLKRGPLLRATLLKMSATDYRLLIIAHLSIVDGLSAYQVLPSELSALCTAFAAGRPSPLRELPIQYADFASWQRRWVQGDVLTRQLAYWRKQLGGDLPVLQWPTDCLRPTAQTFRGAFQPFTLPKRLTEAVKGLGRQERVTLFIILLASFVALLYRYTGQDDIIVGSFSPAGRKRSEVQGLLGYFLNPVALRIDLSGQPSFRELLRQVQRVSSEAISHDDVPIEFLAKELKPQPDPSRHPFFTVAVSLQPPEPDIESGWNVTSMDLESGGAVWDLYLAFIDRPTGMLGRIQYNPDLFNLATIVRAIEDLQVVLEAVTLNPGQRLIDLPVLIARNEASPPTSATVLASASLR